MSTLDEFVTARLYDAKNITPETYESLELDVPIGFQSRSNSSKNSSNTSNIIGQTSQGTISKLHVLNWSTDSNDNNDEGNRRGLFWTYGGEYNRGNIILLRDINIHGEQRLNGDMLHIIVPELCGRIVNIQVIEDHESFDEPINVCISTARGCLFCIRFQHPLSSNRMDDDNNSNNDDRKNLSFLCTRISPELEGIVLPELSSSKNTNIEAEEEVVTSCDWLSNSKANVGLSSGKIILAHFPRSSSSSRKARDSRRKRDAKAKKPVVKEIILFPEVSLTSRIWSGLGFSGNNGNNESNVGNNNSNNAIFAISTCDDIVTAVYGNGIMRTWSMSSKTMLSEHDLAKDLDEGHQNNDNNSANQSRNVVSSKLISTSIDGFGVLTVCSIGFTNGGERLFYFEQKHHGIAFINLQMTRPTSIENTETLIDFSLNMKDTPDNDISLRLQALYIHGNGSEYTVQEYLSNAESIFYRDVWAGPSYCSTLESSLSANVIEEEDLYLSNDLTMNAVVEHFQRRVFFPQRFHRNTIVQALHSCYPEDRDVDDLDDFNVHQLTSQHMLLGGVQNATMQNGNNTNDRDFTQRLSAIVKKHVYEISQRRASIMYNRIVTDDFQVPDDIYAAVSEEEWMKLLKNCVSEWRNSNAPLSLYCLNNQEDELNICGIARRCSVGKFRPLTGYERFIVGEINFEDNTDMIVFNAAKQISNIFSQYSDDLGKEYLHDLKSFHSKDLVLDIVSDDDSGASSSYDFMALAREKLDFLCSLPTSGATLVLQECKARIGNINDLHRQLSSSLNLLLPESNLQNENGNNNQDNYTNIFNGNMKSAENGFAAASVFRKDLQARTIICRDLCLLFAFAEKYDLIEDSELYLDTTLKGLRSFITIGWLSDLVFLKPCRRVTVALADDVSVKVLGRPQADNVVNINSDVGNPIIDLWCSEMMITVQNTDTLLSHIWPSELSDVGAEYLASHGQIEWLKGYSKLLMSECGFDDMSNSRKIACARRHTHLLGEAYLGIRDINKAFHYFLRAAPLEPASLRTRYLLAIIETFSSTMGSPELALQCARIAIATCDSIMDVSVQENHRNTLWHIVFQQTLKCRRYDEACVAVSSLADANEQKVCLKRLIFELQDKNQMDWLCRLPWESMLGGIENVIKYLEQKMMSAKGSLGKNTVFHFLYALSVKYGSYRSAANAMYQLATRLLEQSHAGGPPEIRLARSNALVAATNALRLLPPDEACLIIGNNSAEQKNEKRNRNSEDKEESSTNVKTLKQNKSPRVRILWVKDIAKEAFLEQARQKISLSNPPLVGAEETMNLLLNENITDDVASNGSVNNTNMNINRNYAASLASAFDISLEPVVRATASRCVKLRGREAVLEEEHLKALLKKFDSTTTNFKYHLIAIDTILKIDSRIDPPVWLVESLLGGDTSLSYNNLGQDRALNAGRKKATSGFAMSNGNAEALVRIFMQYGRYNRACVMCTHLIVQLFYHIRAYLNNASENAVLPDEPWIPRALLDDLLRESNELIRQYPEREDIQHDLKISVKQLEDQIYNYFNAVVTLDRLRKSNINGGRP